jgi:DNA/RNA-binding domain of Phe-tRNA-synthetase-like protein
MLDMKFTVRPEVSMLYPSARFGGLTVHNLENLKRDEKLEDAKRALEKEIREEYPDPGDDPVIQNYSIYYDKWDKTYPIHYQINSVKKGRGFPNVSVYVDCMFMAELKNRILTSGHDVDAIQGELVYDLADEGEMYVKLNGETQILVRNDIVLRDNEGVLASVLYGPAARTSIKDDTRSPLYFAWCPHGIPEESIERHLSTICGYLGLVYGEVESEESIVA